MRIVKILQDSENRIQNNETEKKQTEIPLTRFQPKKTKLCHL